MAESSAVARALCVRSADPVPEVLRRLQASIGNPLVSGVDDGLNLRMEPGGLVGHIDGSHVSLWRRGAGNWRGLTRFVGTVREDGTGSILIGAIQLRWRASWGSIVFVGIVVGVMIESARFGPGSLIGEAVFWAMCAAWIVFITIRDHRLLASEVQNLMTGSSP